MKYVSHKNTYDTSGSRGHYDQVILDEHDASDNMMIGGVELMHDGTDLTSEEARAELWAAFDDVKESVKF